jgi:hypothetical protein
MSSLQEKQNAILQFNAPRMWGDVLFTGENRLSDEQLKKMFLILDEKQVDSLLSHLSDEAPTPRLSEEEEWDNIPVCDIGSENIGGYCECHEYQELSRTQFKSITHKL